MNCFMMLRERERSKRRVITRCSVNHLRFTICFLCGILSSSFFLYCSARDTITVDRVLSDGEGETLVSAGGNFELGFFTPEDTAESSDDRRYIGIWYYKSNPRVVVWVANRDKPLLDSNGVLGIEDGNLKLSDTKGTNYWHTNVEISSLSSRVAKLMDSGNLVLSANQLATSLWESFEQPTDTFLTGMNMDQNLKLTSWISQDDPTPGNFTFERDEGVKQYLVRKNVVPYWRSDGESGEFLTYLLSNFSPSTKPTSSGSHIYNFTNMSTIDNSNTRLTMNFTGNIQWWKKDKVEGWSLIWEEPRDNCSLDNFCGKFGSCNSNNRLECKCLPGFEPELPENWESGRFKDGCRKKHEFCGGNDMFISLKMMKVGNPDTKIPSHQKECEKMCRDECDCKAYSYHEAGRSNRDDSTMCWIWTKDLSGLQEEYVNSGRDLYVRVAAADIESTERNCETCGTNLIPYPLSTKPNCGDPNYFSFHCDDLIGQLSFKALNGAYRVTRIDPDTRTFRIQIKDGDNCSARNSGPLIKDSLPFNVHRRCDVGLVNSSSDTTSKDKGEVEIVWKPPLVGPTCTSKRDCQDWPNSTCKLAGNQERRCVCHEAFKWDSRLLNCTPENGNTTKEGGFNIRKKQWTLIAGVTVASVIVLSCTIIYFYFRRKAKRQEERESVGQNIGLRFYNSARHIKDLVETDQFKEEDRKGIDLPFFNFESILTATDNFSETNKLGKGGFGPVYKGTFPGGQEIAVKRLSSVSAQGLEEFKNEIVLIARLQHRNLVRLLGYCIEGDEKILLYEYMPNKSLDSFIFDPKLSLLLDWEMRFNIIMGIARGLLYLHQDSRLRIIHRDLKTSNVLLDQEMNPKISDFGLARIFEGKQTEGTTNRVVGTYGYMSPEYALDGYFSVKSDVFSFGVVVLEIVSGIKNTGFYNSKEALSLLGYAWRLWQEDKALDIMDQKLSASSKRDEVLKCINVGLLCVQEDPNDRPNMSNVVIMLGSETTTLTTPKRPAFVLRRGTSSTASSSSKPESNTKITVSLSGR